MTDKLKTYWKQSCSDWNYIFKEELRTAFRDKGVMIFFLLVPLAYPLLYSFIYTNEVVREVPVAVVDESRSAQSREFLRHADASADVRILSYCADMEEAKSLVKHRDAYGIIFVPEDFHKRLAKGEQTNVSIFTDMSGLLYYKALLTTCTNVSLDMNARIKVVRAGNTTEEQDKVTEHPIAYEEVSIFNPQNGFAAFLIPAVLILILQQTLLLGIGMAAGTAREHNRFRHLVPVERHHTGLLRIVLGKACAYLLIYLPISVYVLEVVPRIFALNQIGNPADMALFAIPYVIACIFFAMTVSGLVKQRESCIILIVFTSVPLLFISGVSWPGSAIPALWQYVGYAFPSTFGINGFVKLNNMGAQLADVRHEWFILWLQATIYFFTACVTYRGSIIASRKDFISLYREKKRARELRMAELAAAPQQAQGPEE